MKRQEIQFFKLSEHPLLPVAYFDTCVPAGFASPAQDYMETEINLNELLIPHPVSTFFVRVKGDSMKDAFISDDALLIVDRSLKAEAGKIIVACIDSEFTVKRLTRNQRHWILHPENSAYKPIPITEGMDFKVWGVVTKIILDAK